MSSPQLVPSLAGRILGSAADDFVVAEWQDPGGPASPPRYIAPWHVHHNDDEAWYVLEGILRVKAGGGEFELRAGSGLMVQHGTPHTYWNPGTERARYLLLMTPRIYKLIQAIHAMQERTPAHMKAVFRNFDAELLA